MSKTIISTDNAPAAIGPYSQAVRTGNTLYISGQLPLDPATKEMPEDAAAQASRSMQNIRAILEAAGCTMDSIVRCGIFVTDLGDFAAINEAYAAFFTGDYPARATVQVAALPLGAKVEIDAIAIVEE
ncbi:MAG: reactive intermediate/imine deaminase [Desulfobulbus sp.]|nr:MAG: reactive intermediate/imine deaminase [Desulfobulbus sp.]RUM40700.1 MAG: reactive intermediate/imine deaminase [Desulfobulbus sp.]